MCPLAIKTRFHSLSTQKQYFLGSWIEISSARVVNDQISFPEYQHPLWNHKKLKDTNRGEPNVPFGHEDQISLPEYPKKKTNPILQPAPIEKKSFFLKGNSTTSSTYLLIFSIIISSIQHPMSFLV